MRDFEISKKDQIFLAKIAMRAALIIEGVSEDAAPDVLDSFYQSCDRKKQAGRADTSCSGSVINL